jgi:flagellar FliL protein
MKRYLLILFPILSLVAGMGVGAALKPAGESGSETENDSEEHHPDELPAYVKLSNQFVVPILRGGEVGSLVILSLSLEVQPGHGEDVYAREPKLRDAFLQVLFDHANAGGFDGDFTEGAALAPLRQALREAAQMVLGQTITDILISDIVRQDS